MQMLTDQAGMKSTGSFSVQVSLGQGHARNWSDLSSFNVYDVAWLVADFPRTRFLARVPAGKHLQSIDNYVVFSVQLLKQVFL